MKIVMTAAHGGYLSDSVPLGGGAAVCERLCRCWAGEVALVGSGSEAPQGIEYHQVASLGKRIPSQLNEFEYAAFSRQFERESSQLILELARSQRVVVLSHDISEGPNFSRLSRAGVDCLSILHVDVVDYFQRFYLGDLLPASAWSWLHRKTRLLPWPDLLQLVFEKQYAAAQHCRYLVVPSEPMRQLLEKSYPDMPLGRVQVVPWGSPLELPSDSEVELAKKVLRERLQLDEGGPLLMTLSRIAPEKSQDLLLRALAVGEAKGNIPDGTTLMICGAPSYMMGQRFLKKLQSLASKLKKVRVLFPGHLGGAEKRAALELATLFVVCSRHESYGLTIMEAMAAGCPIVGVSSYGVESTLGASSGVKVKNCPYALWEGLERLMGARALSLQLGQGALRRAQQCTFEEAAAQLRQLCRGRHR